MSWHDHTINHCHCFVGAWHLGLSRVFSLLLDTEADLGGGKRERWDSTFPALKLLPTQACKSLWKSYAAEIILQPADTPPCAWK